LSIRLAILKNASEKVERFNRIGVHYEAVYHHVIRRRLAISEIYNNEYIDCLVAGLISFDMQRMMGKKKYLAGGDESWAVRLKNKLDAHRSELDLLFTNRIQDIDLEKEGLRTTIASIFDDLSKPGLDGLSKRNVKESFPVGASKILHFLIPDLFVIVDSNARRELALYHDFPKSKMDGHLYHQAMKTYQLELFAWKDRYSDNEFDRLIETDGVWRLYCGERSTPIPRIIDKCTFVGREYY